VSEANNLYSGGTSSPELDDLLPHYYDIAYINDTGIKNHGIICPCNKFFRPLEPSGTGIISIASISMKRSEIKQENTAIVADRGLVYASTQSLYIATYSFDSTDFRETSVIHKFDIESDNDGAIYLVSGRVEGRILNQFSMDEEEGYFRVATTTGWAGFSGEGGIQNYVFVMEEKEGGLEMVGEIRGIAPTEQIYSARFIDYRGFIVTFKKVDPLFTIDLKDPYNPRIVGELKIPGFSTYIHPMDDDHLLTIGKDAEDMGSFAWFQGVQLSIFDVSDFAHPELIQKEIIGSRGTTSEALYNHKAFNYFSKKNLLAIPIVLYEGGTGGSDFGEFTSCGILAYRVDIARGFSLLGQIDHTDFYEDLDEDYYWSDQIGPRRSVIIGDHIYTISDKGMKVNLLDDLSVVSSSIEFP